MGLDDHIKDLSADAPLRTVAFVVLCSYMLYKLDGQNKLYTNRNKLHDQNQKQHYPQWATCIFS